MTIIEDNEDNESHFLVMIGSFLSAETNIIDLNTWGRTSRAYET